MRQSDSIYLILQQQTIMEITVKQLLQALSNVDDPDLKKDIVTLGMVQKIDISPSKIYFEVELPHPPAP